MVPHRGVCVMCTDLSWLLNHHVKRERWRDSESAGTGTYREKNMGKCSDGRMVSIPSTNSDPSTHLRKCELLPSVRRSVSRTHMTDALNWARFNELWSLWAAQLIFSFISQVQMKSGNRRPIAAGERQRSPAICCDRHTCPSYGL